MNGDSMIESNGGDGRGTGAADGTADGTAAVAERRAQTGEPHALDALRTRLRENGLVLLSCGTGGELNAPGSVGVPGEDWLTDLFCGSPLFRKALRRVAEQWNQEDVPREVEVLPGVWLAGTPVLNRRRRSGYVAAIVPTTPLLEAEQLAAMCQSARMDLALCRTRLLALPLASADDVGRLASLVRQAYESSQLVTSANTQVETLGKQLAESYEEMNLLYTITQSMTVQERPERFIALACKELLATLPYSWIGLQLADDRSRLKSMAGRLIIAGSTSQPATIVRSIARALLNSAHPDTPMVLEPGRNPQHAAFAALGHTVLVQPVAAREQIAGGEFRDGSDSGTRNTELIGLLLAGDKTGPDTAASNIDIKLLGATAAHMAIFLENATLYDNLNAMFLGTLEALTASIDAKDRYTCGHSRRVAHLTQALAQAIGLDEYTVSRCNIAGLVHDVGKIGVPEAVLVKPGKLDAQEFAWIRKHPEIGYRILKDIPQLDDILPGVLYHHERWDGKGYPQGLAGESIPLVARLIGLADSFDAMSSNRTYRSALSRAQVLGEIEKCAGSQFDAELARAFLKLNFTTYDKMSAEHQASEAQPVTQQEKAA